MYTSLEKCNAAAAAYYASHPGEKENGVQETKGKKTKKEIKSFKQRIFDAANRRASKELEGFDKAIKILKNKEE